ncbi:MAG: resuscitation-promoting factor RpfA [Acidimicrobiia bacterium]|nr:resuscitation-promoting factor RpfA [Acidimicrobiia bacterium]
MVSLQGTIETFAIADVLRLLAATSKSGRLQVQGPSRSGTVWVDSGNILSAESPNTPYADQPADVLFQLLRFDRGSFRFELDRSPTQPTEPIAIETALHDAEAMVSEFRELEQSIPSIDAWLSLRDSLPDGSVTIGSEHWRGIKAIGSGRSVAGLGDVLALGELPVYRAVNDLLNLGVVDVGAPPADTGSNEAPASSASTLTVPDAPPPSLLDDDEPSRAVEAPADLETQSDEHAGAMSGSGPIATSLSTTQDEGDQEGSTGEGGARRRLDALASSLGLPTSPDNGSAESQTSPPPVPTAGPPAYTTFAPPPPAESSAAPPAGVRPEAGLTSSADTNGSSETGMSGTGQNGVVASSEGTEYVGSAAEGAYGESTRVGPPAGGPAYGDGGEQQPTYGDARQEPPAYGDYGQPQPTYGDGGEQQPAYGDYGQPQPAYGDYAQPQPAYGDYGQQPAYGEYSQPSYGEYGQQQPAYGDYGQQTGYPAPPAYGYEGYGDAAQAYAQPSTEAEAPLAPGAEPGAETQPSRGEVQPGSDPTPGWPISDEAARARTIFESTAPPPPPPPPAPTGSNEGWPAASAWFDGPAPERIAPPPPPPPPPVGMAEPAATSGPNAQGGDEDPANIERQLFNLSDRAREAVKRSSGLFEGRSRR